MAKLSHQEIYDAAVRARDDAAVASAAAPDDADKTAAFLEAETALETIEKQRKIPGIVAQREAEEAERKRRAARVSITRQLQADLTAAVADIKSRSGRVDKALAALACERKAMLADYAECRRITGLLVGKAPENGDQGSLFDLTMYRRLVLLGVPLRAIETDHSTPPVAEYVNNALESLVHEAKRAALKTIKENEPASKASQIIAEKTP